MAHASTVPVALDSTAPASGVDALVRMIYFRITAENPQTRMFFQRGPTAFPFILLGLEGIVLGPAADEELFLSPQRIDELIALIETIPPDQPDEPLAFETSSIWLPFSALELCKKRLSSRLEKRGDVVERGDVFRLSPKAFRKAWWFLDGQVEEASLREFFQFASESQEPPPAIVYSAVETKAFRLWSEDQLGGQMQLGTSTP